MSDAKLHDFPGCCGFGIIAPVGNCTVAQLTALVGQQANTSWGQYHKGFLAIVSSYQGGTAKNLKEAGFSHVLTYKGPHGTASNSIFLVLKDPKDLISIGPAEIKRVVGKEFPAYRVKCSNGKYYTGLGKLGVQGKVFWTREGARKVMNKLKQENLEKEGDHVYTVEELDMVLREAAK